MAKTTFRDVLVKLSNVYLTDIYIYKNQYILGGDLSNLNNPGIFICQLTGDTMKIFDEKLDKSKIYYVSDIKKSKDNFDEYSKEVTDKNEINRIEDLKEKILKEVFNIETWNNFKFNDEEIQLLFNDGISIEIFKNDTKIPSLILSKSMIPLATEKNLDKLYYYLLSTNTEAGDTMINKIIFSLDTELFQVYMYYTYMNW